MSCRALMLVVSLQRTHGGQVPVAPEHARLANMLCNQHYCTIYCFPVLVSAMEMLFSRCFFRGPKEGVKDRVLLAEKTVCNQVCCLAFFSRRSWVRLSSSSSIFETRSLVDTTQPGLSIWGVLFCFFSFPSPSRILFFYINGYCLPCLLIWLGHQLSGSQQLN
ncbi:hypothetical protein ACQKWADRAFT_257664 [Trichoderma austrokoningii]